MKRAWFYMALMAALAIAVSGCGKKESPETSEQPAAKAPAGATVDAATAGSVTGMAMIEGTAPTLKPINMSAEPYCSKAHPTPVVPQEVVVGDKDALANVVVFVKDDLSGKYQFETPKEPATLDQRGCMYNPHVVALMVGQTLQVKNDDQTTHNIHPMPKDNREWNKSQPPGAPPIEDMFARPEVAIAVKCNVHPWMKSYIAVFKQPYFAVTGKDGNFDLKNLPPGTYTIEAWHEKYGTSDQSVTIGPKESKSIMFMFKTAPSGD